MRTLTILITLFCVAVPATLQADVIQLKNGTYLEGKVVEITKDAVVLKMEDAEVKISLDKISPYYVYLLRIDAIDKDDAKAAFELGEFCLENKLYSLSRQEFERALRLDPAFRDLVEELLADADASEAATLYEKGTGFREEKKYEEALEVFGDLIQRFPNTDPALAARGELEKIREEIRLKAEEIQRQINERRNPDRGA